MLATLNPYYENELISLSPESYTCNTIIRSSIENSKE